MEEEQPIEEPTEAPVEEPTEAPAEEETTEEAPAEEVAEEAPAEEEATEEAPAEEAPAAEEEPASECSGATKAAEDLIRDVVNLVSVMKEEEKEGVTTRVDPEAADELVAKLEELAVKVGEICK